MKTWARTSVSALSVLLLGFASFQVRAEITSANLTFQSHSPRHLTSSVAGGSDPRPQTPAGKLVAVAGGSDPRPQTPAGRLVAVAGGSDPRPQTPAGKLVGA